MPKSLGLKEMRPYLMLVDLSTFLKAEREFFSYIKLILKMLENTHANSQALVQQENLLYMVRDLLLRPSFLEKKKNQ